MYRYWPLPIKITLETKKLSVKNKSVLEYLYQNRILYGFFFYHYCRI